MMKKYTVTIYLDDFDNCLVAYFYYGDANYGDPDMPVDCQIELDDYWFEPLSAERYYNYLNVWSELEPLLYDHMGDWEEVEEDIN